MKLQQEVNIAKICAGRLTAGMLPSNFSEGVRSFMQKDEAFQFMSTDKGTPVSWKKFPLEFIFIVKCRPSYLFYDSKQ